MSEWNALQAAIVGHIQADAEEVRDAME